MELTAKGIGGQLTLVDGRLLISHKGRMGRASHGLKGDKEIQRILDTPAQAAEPAAAPTASPLEQIKQLAELRDAGVISDEEFEGFLLELLADYQITIPELGTYKAAHPPIVIITSNRTREIHDALKRRCLYYWVDYPDYQKELQIITARIPDAPRKLAEQVTAFIQEMRETELFKIPGVSETLDWLSALLALNQTELNPDVIDDTLGMMLKYQDDIESVKGEPVRAMLERSQNRGPRRGGRRRG